jgi:predicted enzyme related to lactoylglutathione lyase
MNHLSYFLIYCDDVERGKRFYQAVFGWHIEPCIEGVGNVFYFIDTEGNRVGAMKYDKRA